MRKFWFLRIILFVVVATLAMGLAVTGLWNFLMPVLFKLPAISFGQGIALVVLCRLLFGHIGPRGGHPGWKHGGPWRARLAEKMKNMSPEEREKLREKLRNRWGHCPPWAMPDDLPETEKSVNQ